MIKLKLMKKKIKKSKQVLILVFICLIAFVLRFYLLDRVPNSISADEAAFGYNAYSILETGKDEFGRSFPLLFESFDDHKNPVFVYLLTLFVGLFGLNELAIRLPSAILGVLLIPLFYLLTKKLVNNEKVSLATAFLAAISPWLVHYSRIGLEINTALFLSLLGVWLFLEAEKKNWLYITSSLSFGLAFWTYYSSKLWVVLFGLFLIIFRIRKLSKFFILGILLFVLMILPYVKLHFSGQILSRQYSISVFSNEEERIKTAEFFAKDVQEGNFLGRLIHNRRLVDFNQLAGGYLYILNPSILFAKEIPNQMPMVRLLYLWQLPLVIFGLIQLGKQKKILLFIAVWLALGYIPGAMVILPAFDRRILINSFPLIFLSAIGLVSITNYIYKQKMILRNSIILILFICFLFSFTSYLHHYFIHGQTAVIDLWGNGMKKLVEETEKKEDGFNEILVSTGLDQPWIYFLFYKKYLPEEYLSFGGTVDGSIFSQKNHFGKYKFQNIPSGDYSKETLYILHPEESYDRLITKETIYTSSEKPMAKISIFCPKPIDCPGY